MRIDLRGTQAQRGARDTKRDALVASLSAMTPAQIDAWVDANVTTVGDVRRVLKALVKLAVFR